MNLTAMQRLGAVTCIIFALDQLTKFIILQKLGLYQERIVIPGFFKFVYWGNTGAAWSLFSGQNGILAVVSATALVGLFIFRHHFSAHLATGQLALGLMFGGILGNLTDRLNPARQHVIDFIYFFVTQRNGKTLGFPAFNVADSAICVGVALLFLLSWQQENSRAAATAADPQPESKS